MNITVAVTFISLGIRVQRRGTFQNKGRIPEKVAVDWINQINKEMNVEEILKVEADGVDITSRIIEVE